MVGALLAAAGAALPGSDAAVAEGNSLGRGPLVFHLPQARARGRGRSCCGLG